MKSKIEKLIENLNPEQREAVLSEDNTVVSAGAGSGKTMVLALRYVRLVLEGKAGVENILTVTFTRKAAAEMYERIYSLLSGFQDDPMVTKQLARFDQAWISTLDSFCTKITRDGSTRYGIPPGFSQDDYENRRLIEDVSLRFLLERRENRVIKRLIVLEGFERVWRDLFAALAASYLPMGIVRDFYGMFRFQTDHLESLLAAVLEEILNIFRSITSIEKSAAKAVSAAHDIIYNTRDELHDLLIDIENGTAGVDYHRKVGKLVGSIAFSKRVGNAKKPEVLQYKEYVDSFKAAAERVADISSTLDEKEYLEELFSLCGEFQRSVHLEKQRRGLLSYADVQQMALTILRENRAIRDFYKEKFRYIMIDEFQDNNRLQKELLYLLSEKDDAHTEAPTAEELTSGKLFFVGDEKQSIYRFRGADVSVFRELGEELAGTRGSSISLTTNYRSGPGLVDFFNFFFANVLRDPREKYEARFEPLTARERWGEAPPHISLFFKPYPDGKDNDGAEGNGDHDKGEFLPNDEAEAFHIARYIKQCVKDKMPIPEKMAIPEKMPEGPEETKKRSRPARYSDFALLMRSTGNQVLYERMFRRFGIPYSTQNVRTLFLEAPANDIYNLLQCVVYPGDRAAYAGLLRSPLVNVSDASFVRIMLDGSPAFADDLAESVVSDKPSGPDGPGWSTKPGGPVESRCLLEPEDIEKYKTGRERYLALREKADVVPITELLHDIWYTFGYRYLILKDPTLHSYLEFYDYLYHLAEDADKRGDCLAVFLDFLRSNLGKYEKLEDIEILKDNPEGVRIMTVHKSKGLEFPVVIVANMGNLGRRGDEKRSPFYLCDEFGLTFNLTEEDDTGNRKRRYNYFYARGEEENKKKELAELKRLLYVAATRAQSHLVFSGVHNRRNRSDGETGSTLLNLTLNALPRDRFEDGRTNEITLPNGTTVNCELIEDITEEDVRGHTSTTKKIDPEKMVPLYENTEVEEFRFSKRDFAAIEFDKEFDKDFAGTREKEAGEKEAGDTSGEQGAKATEGTEGSAFGTLCHYILEQMLLDPAKAPGKNEDASSNPRGIGPGSVPFPVPSSLTAPFPRRERAKRIEEAVGLARAFFASEAGGLVKGADSVEAELPFLLRVAGDEYGYDEPYERVTGKPLSGERFISGRIDLFIETKEKGYVVDFKSDHVIDPDMYRTRMEIYRRAAGDLTGKKVECALYYLRRQKTVWL